MPNDNKAAWRLTDKGWLYIVGDAQRAGAGLLTLLVDDVDEWIADLARRGLAPDAIETIPGPCARRSTSIRTATGSPSGSRWAPAADTTQGSRVNSIVVHTGRKPRRA